MNKPILPVSLICTTFNEGENVKAFLDSVYNGTAWPAEFVIVDGGSTDGTADIIERYTSVELQGLQVKLIRMTERINIAKGRNMAIDAAAYPVIAAIDAGCLADVEWLEALTEPLLRPAYAGESVDVVSGWYKPLITSKFHARVARALVPKLDEIDPKTFLPSSRSLAFRKACWEAVGGYPEWMKFAGEDTQFDIAMKNAGFKFVFTPQATVRWMLRNDMKSLYKQQYRYGFGDGEAGQLPLRSMARVAVCLFPLLLLLTPKGFKEFRIRYWSFIAMSLGWMAGTWKKVTA